MQRRGEKIKFLFHFLIYNVIYIWGYEKILFFIGKKWNGSHHLVFWSLGTLTGLRDWIWGLVA